MKTLLKLVSNDIGKDDVLLTAKNVEKLNTLLKS